MMDSLLAVLFPERLSGDNLPHQRSIVSSGDDLSSSLLSSQDGVIKTITLKKLMMKRKHLIMRLWLQMKSCTKGDIRGLLNVRGRRGQYVMGERIIR